MMKRVMLLLVVGSLSGCASLIELFMPGQTIAVSEVGRAEACPAQSSDISVQYFISAEAVLNWQANAGLALSGGERLQPGGYAVVWLGQRESGGYGLLVDPSAYASGDVIRLHVTRLEPIPGVAPPEGATNPCVLVQLPAGNWKGVRVYDQSGKLRAKSFLR